jgi:hypothetical protein
VTTPRRNGELHGDYEALRRMGELNYISTVAGLLAAALFGLERLDEADEFTRISDEMGAPDDMTTQVAWRCVRAKLLAHQGSAEVAEKLATEAIALVDNTDYLDAQGRARIDLAEVYQLGGRESDERRVLAEAAVRFARKGTDVSLAAVKRLMTVSSIAE